MRIFRFITRALMAASATGLVALAVEAQNQTTPPSGATVTRLQGKARFSTDSKTWQGVRKGVELGAGTMIQTADNSTVELRLGAADSKEREANTLRLAPNSVLVIEALTAEPQDVELDLRNGEMSGRAGQLVSGARYEVKVSTGIVGVKNGSYRVTSAGTIDALSGELVVASVGRDGAASAKTVTAGHRLDLVSGAVTSISAGSEPPSSVRSESSTEPASKNPSVPAQKGPGLGGSPRKF